MSLVATICGLALQFGSPYLENQIPPADYPDVRPLAERALSENELADVHGMGLPQVGLDEADHATNVRSVQVALAADLPSQQLRDVVDNWNVQVASLLIAQAVDQVRQ